MALFQEDSPIPDVFPTPSGNIQFEWSCCDLDIEIEIRSNRKCTASFDDLADKSRYWEKEFTYDLTVLMGAIEELTQRYTHARLQLVNG